MNEGAGDLSAPWRGHFRTAVRVYGQANGAERCGASTGRAKAQSGTRAGEGGAHKKKECVGWPFDDIQ